MTERNDHRDRWSDEIAAYALGALGEREAALLEHHLGECESCVAELLWLRPAVDVIPASVEQHTPPPELRERLMATVREEAEPAAVARPARAKRSFRLPGFGSVGLRPALVAGAVLLLAAGVAGYSMREGDSAGEPQAQTFAAVADVPGTTAHGTLEVSGDEGVLHVQGMPPNKANQVYQAWVQEPAGAVGKSTVHPSTVFVVSESGSGEVAIPKGLDDAARVMITREPKGGSEVPSESPMMTAEID